MVFLGKDRSRELVVRDLVQRSLIHGVDELLRTGLHGVLELPVLVLLLVLLILQRVLLLLFYFPHQLSRTQGGLDFRTPLFSVVYLGGEFGIFGGRHNRRLLMLHDGLELFIFVHLEFSPQVPCPLVELLSLLSFLLVSTF